MNDNKITPFIITCAARTGSTMLRYMLDGHPEITCHGEVFTVRGISRGLKADKRPYGLSPLYDHLSQEFKSNTIIDFIPKHLLNRSDEKSKASGFKFKTDEYFNPAFTEVANYVRSNNEIKVIHLKRRDLLAQYISHLMVKEKKSKTVEFKEGKSSPGVAITISISRLMNFMEDVVSREEKILEELQDHDTIEVHYEDILEINSQSVKDLQLFLNVTPQPLHTKTKKILSGYRSLIKNESEVIAALQYSMFRSRIGLL
jgi:hypothetical protein